MRNPNTRRQAASALARRMSRARWAKPRPIREETPEDARARALEAARGRRERHGDTYHADGTVTPWQVRRSVRGRTDQVDVLAGARLLFTMGRRKVGKLLRAR